MYPKLKYLYLLLCVACAGYMVASCSSEQADKIDYGKGAEVSFAVSDATRTSATISIDRFAVYGDMRFTGEDTASPAIIFDNTEVVKTDNGWQYQGARYWFPNYEHSFVALHPHSVLDAAQYSDSELSFTYTLPNSHDDAADLLVATHRRLYREGDAVSPISFRFSHLLSLINFSVELTEPSTRNEECFKIHEFEMSGFGTSVAINVKPAPRQDNLQTNDSEIDIVTAKGNGSLKISFDEPIEVTNGSGAVKLLGDDNAIIMLPQTFASNDKVEISLTYSVNDETETTEVSGSLSDFTWELGKSYNYKIKLELDEVKEANMVIGNATIAPWILIDDPNIVDAR